MNEKPPPDVRLLHFKELRDILKTVSSFCMQARPGVRHSYALSADRRTFAKVGASQGDDWRKRSWPFGLVCVCGWPSPFLWPLQRDTDWSAAL